MLRAVAGQHGLAGLRTLLRSQAAAAAPGARQAHRVSDNQDMDEMPQHYRGNPPPQSPPSRLAQVRPQVPNDSADEHIPRQVPLRMDGTVPPDPLVPGGRPRGVPDDVPFTKPDPPDQGLTGGKEETKMPDPLGCKEGLKVQTGL